MDWFDLGFRVIPALVVLVCAVAVVRGIWLLVASSRWPVATAKVTDFHTTVHGTAHERAVRHHAAVEFQTPTGDERRAVVPYVSFLGTPALGGSLSVRYDPKNARRAVMDRLSTRGLPEIVGGVVVGAGGLYFLSTAMQSMPF